MDAFERHILETIDKYKLIEPGQMVIAGVSGGYDSLCMLNALYNLRHLRKFNLCVAHINHMLRKEADSDMEYVRQFTKGLGLDFFAEKTDVAKYSEENKISFETAGRILRYDFFNKVADNFENSVIATAHNAMDSAESMLMHLMRGSGLKGLMGIRPKNGNIIRPLIETSREDIEKYCDGLGIVPRHDCTNDSDDYHRNDIRHNVLKPILKRCSLKSLCRTMDVLSEEEEFMDLYTKEIFNTCVRYVNGKIHISIKKINNLPLAIKRRLLKMCLNDSPKNQLCLVHIDDIIAMAEKNYGGKSLCLPEGIVVKIEKGEIIL